MRSVLIIILKTVLGGVLGAFIFLGLGSIKGLFDLFVEFVRSFNEIFMSFDPSLLMMIPFGILSGAARAVSFGGDLVLLSTFIGSEIAFLKNFHKAIFSQFSFGTAKQVFRATFLVLVITTAFCIYVKIQRIIQVEYTYSSFCASVRKKDYLSAYKYLSPEYRNQKNLDQFIEDKLRTESLYVEVCSSHGHSFTFASSFGNIASIFPYQFTVANSWANPFLSGSEIIMKNINGEWYLTGDGYSYY